MINNEFILNINSKDLTKTNSKINNDRSNNKVRDNDFKKILKERTENPVKDKSEITNTVDNRETLLENDFKSGDVRSKDINSLKNNEFELSDDISLEEVIKDIVELISNEENFQGNNTDNEVIEELVALLNQIINLPEFKSLLPVKLEDPMFIANTTVEIENSNIHINKEAFDLLNTIVEALKPEKVNGVISNDLLNGFKEVLEILSNELLNQGTDLIKNSVFTNEVVNEKNIEVKELKNKKVIKIDESDNESVVANESIAEASDDVDIKNILTDLKSNLNSYEDSKIEVEMSKYGASSEVISSEDDKVLDKILGIESESGALSKQNNFINRLNIKGAEVIKESMTINKETMDVDIIKNVKFMMKNSVSELKVKIYPKELGEMTIKLLSEEGILKADIKATSKETYNLLNTNLSDIKKTLEQQNIKIQEVNISLYSDDTTYHNGENSRDEMYKNNEDRQGKNSSRESSFLIDDLDNDKKLDEDNSINRLV